MAERWQIEAKPKAVLTAVDPEPVDRGDGVKVQRWRTDKGMTHAQVIYPTGAIDWFQLVAG